MYICKAQYSMIYNFSEDNKYILTIVCIWHGQLHKYMFSISGFYDIIAIVAGVVQTILYCDFFYLYITKVLKGKKLQLPA